MGIINSIRDRLAAIDASVDHHDGHGFNPEVCQGCPKRDTSHPDNPCTLCGCPTVPYGIMDLKDSPPTGCLRLDDHAE